MSLGDDPITSITEQKFQQMSEPDPNGPTAQRPPVVSFPTSISLVDHWSLELGDPSCVLFPSSICQCYIPCHPVSTFAVPWYNDILFAFVEHSLYHVISMFISYPIPTSEQVVIVRIGNSHHSPCLLVSLSSCLCVILHGHSLVFCLKHGQFQAEDEQFLHWFQGFSILLR